MEAVRQNKDTLFITWVPSKGQGLTSYDVEIKVMNEDGEFEQTMVRALIIFYMMV